MHEPFLPPWLQEGRPPAFASAAAPKHNNTYEHWARLPALNHLPDDMTDPSWDINILIKNSGDFSSVIKTVAALPSTYTGTLNLVLNEPKYPIAGRNAILLLTALEFEPEVAVPMMIHLWYSALLPASMLRALRETVLPSIQDFFAGVCTRDRDSMNICDFAYEAHGSSLRLLLQSMD